MKILKGFHSTSMDDYPLNITTLIRHAARTFPEVEVVCRRPDGSLFRYNYGEAYERIKRLANALEGLGIKPGDRVGVMDWNTHRFFESYFGIPGIGAVLLQLNPRISTDDRIHVINHSEPRFIFLDEFFIPFFEPVASQLKTVEGYVIITDKPLDEIKAKLSPIYSYEDLLKRANPHYLWPMIDEKSAYSACYTSGTVGRPKGIYYSHRDIYLHTMAVSCASNTSMNDVVFQLVPMFHAQGWGLSLVAAMVGAKFVLAGPYTLKTLEPLVDLMIQEKVTVSAGAPAILMPMLEYMRGLKERPRFEEVRIFSGATEPPLEMIKGYEEFGVEIIHAYGATEASPLVLGNRLKPHLRERLSEEERWDWRKKQGLPATGLDIKIVDAEGNEVPPGRIGELLIRGPWITGSYYNDPRTKESFSGGYWKSGDWAVIDADGYVKIVDRYKDLIKSGGEWISSVDLENAIMGHPAVLEACVVGVFHPKWEERPLALVVLREGFKGKVSRDEIIDFIRPKFAKWQLPDDLVFVPELPKTSVGKFDKKVVRERYKEYKLPTA